MHLLRFAASRESRTGPPVQTAATSDQRSRDSWSISHTDLRVQTLIAHWNLPRHLQSSITHQKTATNPSPLLTAPKSTRELATAFENPGGLPPPHCTSPTSNSSTETHLTSVPLSLHEMQHHTPPLAPSPCFSAMPPFLSESTTLAKTMQPLLCPRTIDDWIETMQETLHLAVTKVHFSLNLNLRRSHQIPCATSTIPYSTAQLFHERFSSHCFSMGVTFSRQASVRNKISRSRRVTHRTRVTSCHTDQLPENRSWWSNNVAPLRHVNLRAPRALCVLLTCPSQQEVADSTTDSESQKSSGKQTCTLPFLPSCSSRSQPFALKPHVAAKTSPCITAFRVPAFEESFLKTAHTCPFVPLQNTHLVLLLIGFTRLGLHINSKKPSRPHQAHPHVALGGKERKLLHHERMRKKEHVFILLASSRE